VHRRTLRAAEGSLMGGAVSRLVDTGIELEIWGGPPCTAASVIVAGRIAHTLSIGPAGTWTGSLDPLDDDGAGTTVVVIDDRPALLGRLPNG
jgi:hypothetical protein